VKRIPEYDDHPDNYRKSLENQCIKKHPHKARAVDSTQLERKLTWDNYKQNFVTILNKESFKKDNDAARKHIHDNIVPGSSPVCC
jgi:hypothetical protein